MFYAEWIYTKWQLYFVAAKGINIESERRGNGNEKCQYWDDDFIRNTFSVDANP